jgi:hypothetical protein
MLEVGCSRPAPSTVPSWHTGCANLAQIRLGGGPGRPEGWRLASVCGGEGEGREETELFVAAFLGRGFLPDALFC